MSRILHFKKVKVNNKVIAWIGIFILFSVFLINLFYMRYVSKDMKTYLKFNTQEFDLNNKTNKINIGNTKGYRVFLAREEHAQTKSYAMKKNLIEFFNKNLNIRYILIEIGFGSGIVLDDYIQTGKEEELKYYMSNLKGTSAYTNEESEFWKSLYEYNKNLDDDKKIHIIGLDVDHQIYTSIKSIALLIDDDNLDEDLSDLNKLIEDNDECVFFKLIEAIDKYPDKVEKEFGKNYDVLKQLCKNFNYTYKYFNERKSKNERDYDIRDEAMMSNFLYAYNTYKDELFFGEFGAEHIYQSSCETKEASDKYNRFGMRLNESSSPVKGKVCSMLYVYPYGNNLDLDSVDLLSKYIDYSAFKNYYKKDTIISLDERNSPFLNNDNLCNNDSEITCNYIQKIIVLPDSEKCSAFDGNLY